MVTKTVDPSMFLYICIYFVLLYIFCFSVLVLAILQTSAHVSAHGPFISLLSCLGELLLDMEDDS